MPELRYRIGRVDTEPDFMLRFKTLFVVEADEGTHSLFAASQSSHHKVREHFGLKVDKMVGGGDLYVRDGTVILDDYSASFGAISVEVAERFGELLVPELQGMGIDVRYFMPDPARWAVNSYWTSLDFKRGQGSAV